MGKKRTSALTDQQISEQVSRQIANASTGTDGELMYRDHARDGDRRLYRHRGRRGLDGRRDWRRSPR
jgi:hypothetical protein